MIFSLVSHYILTGFELGSLITIPSVSYAYGGSFGPKLNSDWYNSTSTLKLRTCDKVTSDPTLDRPDLREPFLVIMPNFHSHHSEVCIANAHNHAHTINKFITRRLTTWA